MLTLVYTCYMKLSKNIVLNPKDGNRTDFYQNENNLLQVRKIGEF